MIPNHFQVPMTPTTTPQAMVRTPHTRITLLTPRLVRLEYSPTDEFEDHASQTFWHRAWPAPEFKVDRTDAAITIETEYLRLIYRLTERGFASDTLSIEVLATSTKWKYGDRGEWQNLRGTTRTLDGVNGATHLDRGLMSRDGWSIVDDSRSLVFRPDGWLMPRPHAQNVDLYFFGYGHDYQQCLADFCKIAGRVPLIPRWALGNWWSRYWEYTQQSLLDLMVDFEQHAIPLSVCIIDMDWHITQTGNDSTGWTGYTWNRDLFPDPSTLIDWLHRHGLKTALNLHPAEGIHPHEEQYGAMARALNLDPAVQRPIDFNLADPEFARAYFEILHHPYETLGVDFWWLDWQQGSLSQLPGLDPLMWLNHLHFHDLGRDGSKRPFIFSRWFGLGNHRYPIGFSGDSVVSWESLAFQPYFTATAANVGYSWWSHDIGGHMLGIEDGELYARWVQYGVFSPILRLHSTKNPYQDRRPWANDAETFRVIRAAMQLRHQLIPYIYTMAWRNHTQDVPLITPLYYEQPEVDDAYRCPQAYTFGTELIAAPYTSPIDPDTRLSRQTVWLPAGHWFNFFDAEHFYGNHWYSLYGRLDEIPVFARAGAIIPLAGEGESGVRNPSRLDLHIFPAADNRFELYEDDGETSAYQSSHFALTALTQHYYDTGNNFTIEPTAGDLAVLPAQRHYRLIFRGVHQPDRVEVRVNGELREVATSYIKDTASFIIDDVLVIPTDRVEVTARMVDTSWMTGSDRRATLCRSMLRTFRLGSGVKEAIDRDLALIFEDVDRLKRYGADLKDAHVAALTSVIQRPD